MLTAHVVAHTHWDREWYQTHVRFRQRLVAMIDELLDDPPQAPASFLLDGQAIVLEDYLAVRPERAAELSALLQRQRLEAGPWYVLADELIPGGEALVRNLLTGRRVLRALRAEPPPVLYCPDSFGHPATLPLLADGFGLPLIVLWRGYGGARWPAGDVVRWRAPSGVSAIVFHLPRNGYEYGSNLPSDDGAAITRWKQMRDELGGRSRAGVTLIQNGADHHARQVHQRQAVEALGRAARATGDSAVASSLGAFAEQLEASVESSTLPAVEGELRDSYGYSWTLQGTFATRAAQKRRNALAERLLLRDAEPWAALAARNGGPSRVALLAAAWKSLLQCHPHDTLCGCSIDAVARAMDVRLDDAMHQARGIRDDALANLVGHDPDAARPARESWQPSVIIRNCSARARGGVAFVEIARFVADVPVGPGSAAPDIAAAKLATRLRLANGSVIQALERRLDHDRLEPARSYPDNDLVEVTRAAIWVDAVPAYGTQAIRIGGARQRAIVSPPHPVRAEARTLDNGILRVHLGDEGSVSIEESEGGRKLENVLLLEDRIDAGDLYTPSIREVASRAELITSRVTRGGPLVGEIALRWRLVPVDERRRRPRPRADLTARVSLRAGEPCLHVHVEGRNLADNHRLRLALRTDVSNGETWADVAFGTLIRRPIAVMDRERAMETPPTTAPLHRYVSLFAADRGATLFSDGLAEYETTARGEVFVTLLRAVGELSRNDLPERPGHAGWPAATPDAQSRGPFACNLALMLHGPRTARVVDAVERTADDVLLPLAGTTIRSMLDVPAPRAGISLEGAGLAFSALKEAETGGGIIARCVNLLDDQVHGTWHLGFAAKEAHLARLDETPLEPLEPLVVSDSRVSFVAPPRGVVTILLR